MLVVCVDVCVDGGGGTENEEGESSLFWDFDVLACFGLLVGEPFLIVVLFVRVWCDPIVT